MKTTRESAVFFDKNTNTEQKLFIVTPENIIIEGYPIMVKQALFDLEFTILVIRNENNKIQDFVLKDLHILNTRKEAEDLIMSKYKQRHERFMELLGSQNKLTMTMAKKVDSIEHYILGTTISNNTMVGFQSFIDIDFTKKTIEINYYLQKING